MWSTLHVIQWMKSEDSLLSHSCPISTLPGIHRIFEKLSQSCRAAHWMEGFRVFRKEHVVASCQFKPNVVFDCRSLRLDGTTGTEQASLSVQASAESSPKLDHGELSILSLLPVAATEDRFSSSTYRGLDGRRGVLIGSPQPR
jgi:hypothetical protein